MGAALTNMFGLDRLRMVQTAIRAAVASRIFPLAWVFGVALVAALIARDMMVHRNYGGLSINGTSIWGADFVNVWTSGRLVLEEHLGILYDIEGYRVWQSAVFGPGISGHNYSYPPLTLLYTPVFGALPYLWALALWLMLSGAAFTLAAHPWLRRYGLPSWLGAVLPTTIVCLWAGHYGLFLGALWLLAWHFLDRKPQLSGVLIGLMAIKPHLALLMPLVLLRRKAWTAIAWAALTVCALAGMSLLIFGPALWQTYLTSTSQDQIDLVNATDTFFIKMMPTLAPALFSYGLPMQIVWALQGLLAVSVAAALWRDLPEDRYQAGLVTGIATFLVLPYAFNYDMTVVGLAALIMMADYLRRGLIGLSLLAAFFFVMPTLITFYNAVGLWISPLALAALFVAALRYPPLRTHPRDLASA